MIDMGTKARAEVKAAGLNISDLVQLLNKAFSDAWLA